MGAARSLWLASNVTANIYIEIIEHQQHNIIKYAKLISETIYLLHLYHKILQNILKSLKIRIKVF
jgi:hypothetical protein